MIEAEVQAQAKYAGVYGQAVIDFCSNRLDHTWNLVWSSVVFSIIPKYQAVPCEWRCFLANKISHCSGKQLALLSWMASIYIWNLSRSRDGVTHLFPDKDITKTLSYSILLDPSYKVQLCTVTNFSASQKY